MKLLSHWNLRDELKVDYDNQEKQEMIYQVMDRIVRQTIPAEAINNADYVWKPYSTTDEREADVRYQKILDVFHAMQQMDVYCPTMPTAIIRNFEGDIEIPAEEVERLFKELIGSEQVKTVAEEIKARLGRELRPYDIWYDGFKARSGMDENKLSAQTRKRFPTPESYEKQIACMLTTLGFQKENAEDIAHELPYKFEAGTPNFVGSHALKVAMDYIRGIGWCKMEAHERELTEYCEKQLLQIGCKVYGVGCKKAGVISFNVYNGEELVHPFDIGTLLDQQGVAVRTGHHCAEPLIDTMGVPGTVRVSFGLYNELVDVDAFIAALQKAIKILC